MKHRLSLLSLALTCAAGLLSFEACAPDAQAQSFNPTNSIVNGASANATLFGYPTNTSGVMTGNAIQLPNDKEAGFFLSCLPVWPTATNSSTLTIGLVRAWTANPPSTYYTPNSWTTNSDWETLPSIVLSITIPGTNTIGSNCFNFYTNLPVWQVGEAQWIGIYGMTNSLLGEVLTNFNCGLAKKIVPIRYP